MVCFCNVLVKVKERSAEDFIRGVLNNTHAIFVSDFLKKIISYVYSFELPQLVEAIQMSTHNICFYKEDD